MDVTNSVNLYIAMLNYVLPFIVVFSMGNMLVGMVLRAAFGGKLRIE